MILFCLLPIIMITHVDAQTCATTEYYSTTLATCLTCSTGCASCCD